MKTIIPIISFLIFSNPLLSQLKADFSTTDGKTGGCSPYIVSFKNLTTGASLTAVYKWDLGNNNSSQNPNPGATYIEEKDYTITLSVTDSGQTVFKSIHIIVYKKPAADFTVDKIKGCNPFSVIFKSSSSSSDGDIRNYFWDFGDGTTVSKTLTDTASHTFTVAQKLNVRLVVTNSYGCQNSIQKMNVTEAIAIPNSSISADKTIVCKTTDPVNFKAPNNVFDGVNYLWDLGDGSTSTQKSPTHVYNKKGTYDIKLTAASSSISGCSSSSVQAAYINVSNFSSDFTVSSPLCVNTATVLQNKSLPAASLTAWYFSDDNYRSVSNGISVSKNFTTAGIYTARLINTFAVCRDTVEKKIRINATPVLQGFIINDNAICGLPYTASFKDTCRTAAKWNWNFNASDTNAVSFEQTAIYTYTSNNNYKISLIVTDTAGCTATTNKTLAIQKSNIAINILSSNSTGTDKTKGCPGITIKFTVADPTLIADYLWNFDDGTTTSIAQPEHSFLEAKDYHISLTYTTVAGCKGTVTFLSPITVNQKPTANFKLSSNQACGNTKILFTDQSTPATDKWFWNFGDNSFSDLSSNNKNIYHQYTDSGSFNVQLVAFNGGCSDTIVKKTAVHIMPPFIKINTTANTCDGARGLVTFSQSSKYVSECIWDFGDNTTQAVKAAQIQIDHNYQSSGVYTATITANYLECAAVDSIKVYVLLKQQPAITADKTSMCGSDSLQVRLDNLLINPSRSANGYSIVKWQYNDLSDFNGASFSQNDNWTNIFTTKITSLKTGEENIRAIIKSAYFGCTDTTAFIPLKINGPEAAFNISNNQACFKSTFHFIDTSSLNNTIAINQRIWNFGDDSLWVASNNKMISHIYTSPGIYTTTLKVIDDNGCFAVSKTSNSTIVGGAKANFQWSPIPVTPGASITFLNATTVLDQKNVQYLWKFSNNNYTDTSSEKVVYKYPNICADTVMLIAVDAANHCTDTSVQYVKVNKMLVSFNFTSNYIDSNNCPPLVLYAKARSVYADSLSWNFGDGSIAGNVSNPSHTYGQPGIYKITLYGYVNTIVDSSTDFISIKGPYATLKADVYQKCSPATVNLSASLKNAISYAWDFNDGTLQLSSDTIVNHRYSKPGIYNPSLVMRDSAGCNSAFNLPAKIIMDTLSASIKASAVSICDSSTVNFTSDIVSIAAGDLHQNLQYKWFFGTAANNTSNQEDPSFLYSGPGKYIVTLMLQSAPGCIIQTSDTVLVNPLPVVNAGPDKYILSGSSVILGPVDSDDDISYLWNSSLYLDRDTSLNPICSPLTNQTYTLTATTKAGCTRTDTMNVFILSPINIPNAFSPNGDGINDTWKVKYLENYPGATVDIFDRLGQPVYHSEGYNQEWDGTLNRKPLPFGTYYYIINPKNNMPAFSGSVTIIR